MGSGIDVDEKSDMRASGGVVKRDWHYLKDATEEVRLGHPGVKAYGKGLEVHRSHLALLPYTHPAIAPDVKRGAQAAERWAARAARLATVGVVPRVTQQLAVDFIERRRGTLLGDDMRLGKTAASLMAHDPARGSLVIVAPLQARAVWLGWIRRVFPDTPIGIFIGKTFDPKLAQLPIVFVHYEIVHKWQVIRPIGTLVFDEAHALTNIKSRRSIACALLASMAEVVIAMTGTPVWNLPPNLYGLISLVNPGAWGSFYDFASRYGAPEPTAHGIKYTGISHGEELNKRMTEVMLRRTWKEVGGVDLPAITRNVEMAEVNDAARKKLDVIAAALIDQKTNTAGNLSSYRRAASLFKLPTVVAKVETILKRNEPVVVWAWHVDTATLIAESIRKAGYITDDFPNRVFLITGEQSVNQREEQIAAWKAHPAAVLVCTMAVAQTAVDFSHSRLAIFAELDWTPGVIAQAEMRTYDATRSMNVTFIVLNHVVDLRMVMALERKLTASNPIGVGTASESIEALRLAVFGEKDEGDMERFLEDLLAA